MHVRAGELIQFLPIYVLYIQISIHLNSIIKATTNSTANECEYRHQPNIQPENKEE